MFFLKVLLAHPSIIAQKSVEKLELLTSCVCFFLLVLNKIVYFVITCRMFKHQEVAFDINSVGQKEILDWKCILPCTSTGRTGWSCLFIETFDVKSRCSACVADWNLKNKESSSCFVWKKQKLNNLTNPLL